MTKHEEQQLINKILSGNEKSLFTFYKYYSPKILSYLKRRTPTYEDAQELLQDTLLSSLDALRDFTFKSTLSTFLHAIAKHKLIDFLRKKRLKKILLSQAPQLEAMLVSLSSPESMYEKQEHKQLINKALNRLKPIYRKIIHLKYMEDKSVAQITHELNLTFKSAESLLFRARKAFARSLNKY